ncbi:putative oxidoreductase [Gordonia araii NBRC 100433]|uniref:Putative oxidoreductase n=1 Tax=Gordonia araii NBRC 100433 TaxID=1073574 RepID=G7H514_9ACTN|nr:zinc-binding alcohol dehydrogenase family protein [Gordonia araii]NNG96629.1 zinc-binding alcohol dehydrogenase family protein [Gordonia araii NBRC 100433]GAB10939.1 putative oxidoreductase [Gordonia araii NBRC 100433]
MKAAVISGPDQQPRYADFAEPVAGDDHRIVDLVAAGIHNIVRARATGHHYSSDGIWPLIPGVDAVARTDDGRLIYTGMVAQPWGTMAQRMAVPTAFGLPLPDGVDPLAVAAGCNPGLASWLPLSMRHAELTARGADLGSVLILGATGMAGRIAVDNALTLGANAVVAVGRNTDALARIATDDNDQVRTVALTGSGDADRLGRALDGIAPSTVIDFVWGTVAELTFDAIASLPGNAEVTHIDIGESAGATARVPGSLLRSRPYTIVGSGLGSVDPATMFDAVAEFIGLIDAGRVRIPYASYRLSDVARAWTAHGPQRAVVVPD